MRWTAPKVIGNSPLVKQKVGNSLLLIPEQFLGNFSRYWMGRDRANSTSASYRQSILGLMLCMTKQS